MRPLSSIQKMRICRGYSTRGGCPYDLGAGSRSEAVLHSLLLLNTHVLAWAIQTKWHGYAMTAPRAYVLMMRSSRRWSTPSQISFG